MHEEGAWLLLRQDFLHAIGVFQPFFRISFTDHQVKQCVVFGVAEPYTICPAYAFDIHRVVALQGWGGWAATEWQNTDIEVPVLENMFMPGGVIKAGDCHVNINLLEIVLDELRNLYVFAVASSVLEIDTESPSITFYGVPGLIQDLGSQLRVIFNLFGIGVMPPCGEWSERNVPNTQITPSEVDQVNDFLLVYCSGQRFPHFFLLEWLLP